MNDLTPYQIWEKERYGNNLPEHSSFIQLSEDEIMQGDAQEIINNESGSKWDFKPVTIN